MGMKFKALPIIYRAVVEGINNGMGALSTVVAPTQEAKAQMVPEVLASAVMQSLGEVIDFEVDKQTLDLLEKAGESRDEHQNQ